MNEEYKSVEQRVYDSVKPNLETAVKGFYGTMMSPFRIPTLIRKVKESQICADKIDGKSFQFYKLGLIGGMLIEGTAAQLMMLEATKSDNYTPLIATATTLATTNLASLFYELGRKSRKRSQKEDEIGDTI